MKMRNVFLALTLTLLASFSFSSTLNANTVEAPVIEDGVTGVINEISMDNGMIVFQLNSTQIVELSLINDSGQTVWTTKTNTEVITIPTNALNSGFYTLVAKVNKVKEFHMVHIQNQVNLGEATSINSSDF